MDVAHAVLFARKLDVSRLTVRYLSAKFEFIYTTSFGSAGGISGTILSGMDFVKDYHEYSGRDLVKVWGTDAFALATGFGGSAIGGTLLGGPPGAYVGGVLGGVGGAYVKSWLREGIKKDKEKAAAAYKDIERR